MNIIEISVHGGAEITRTIANCIKIAAERGAEATFVFNEVRVHVRSDSDPDLIYRDWRRCLEGKIFGQVGPHPATELTGEEIASDARRDAELAEQRRIADEEYRSNQARETREITELLLSAPAMDRDEAKWQEGIFAQNGEPYGLACYEYAERWARLMQKRMVAGQSIADVAEECGSSANKGIGITGFMYGAAVSILAATWEHGDELRRWHNAQYGVSEAKAKGGTVSPAILTVSA